MKKQNLKMGTALSDDGTGADLSFINNYMPMAGLVVAFKNYNVVDGIFGSPWAGLSNFTYLFNDAWTITRNTLLYNIVFIIINLILGIAFAIFICDIRSKACKTIYQSAILLPFLMSIVIVSYITFAFFSGDNGMLNKTILPFFGKEAINWYSESKYWPVILVIVNTWKGVGYGCLIYISSISGIDPSFMRLQNWMELQSETDPIHYTSIDHAVCNHFDTVKHWKNFLF